MVSIRGWFTTVQAARLTGYNVEYIRQLIRTRKIRAEKWGRDWIINQASLLGYEEKEERRGPRPKRSP